MAGPTGGSTPRAVAAQNGTTLRGAGSARLRFEFEGKVVLVTGVGRAGQIGHAVALAFGGPAPGSSPSIATRWASPSG